MFFLIKRNLGAISNCLGLFRLLPTIFSFETQNRAKNVDSRRRPKAESILGKFQHLVGKSTPLLREKNDLMTAWTCFFSSAFSVFVSPIHRAPFSSGAMSVVDVKAVKGVKKMPLQKKTPRLERLCAVAAAATPTDSLTPSVEKFSKG